MSATQFTSISFMRNISSSSALLAFEVTGDFHLIAHRYATSIERLCHYGLYLGVKTGPPLIISFPW